MHSAQHHVYHCHIYFISLGSSNGDDFDHTLHCIGMHTSLLDHFLCLLLEHMKISTGLDNFSWEYIWCRHLIHVPICQVVLMLPLTFLCFLQNSISIACFIATDNFLCLKTLNVNRLKSPNFYY